MFKRKYKISIIDSQWSPIERNVKVDFVPRAGEFIFFNDTYYKVINLVHTMQPNQEIFVIIDILNNEIKINLPDNQSFTKIF